MFLPYLAFNSVLFVKNTIYFQIYSIKIQKKKYKISLSHMSQKFHHDTALSPHQHHLLCQPHLHSQSLNQWNGLIGK